MAFHVFIISDSIAMYFSMTGAFVLIWALIASDREKFAINNALILLVVAIFTMSMAFMHGRCIHGPEQYSLDFVFSFGWGSLLPSHFQLHFHCVDVPKI